MRRGLSTVSVVACLAALSVSCAEPPTLIVVVVDTDLAVPRELNAIATEITTPDGTLRTAVIVGETDTAFPITVALVHDGGPLGPFRVHVEGHQEGTPVVEREASVHFEPHKSLVLVMHLVEGCIGQTCPEGQTCSEEGCISVERGPLPSWDGAVPRLGDGQGSDGDAGADAGTDAEAGAELDGG